VKAARPVVIGSSGRPVCIVCVLRETVCRARDCVQLAGAKGPKLSSSAEDKAQKKAPKSSDNRMGRSSGPKVGGKRKFSNLNLNRIPLLRPQNAPCHIHTRILSRCTGSIRLPLEQWPVELGLRAFPFGPGLSSWRDSSRG